MKKQVIYDKVCAHLAQQKHQSKNNGGCLYRSDNGDKCAAGALLPDELYAESMEGKQAGHPMVKGAFIQAGYSDADVKFIEQLQNAHDEDEFNAEGLQRELCRVAKLNDVSTGAERAITEWNDPA